MVQKRDKNGNRESWRKSYQMRLGNRKTQSAIEVTGGKIPAILPERFPPKSRWGVSIVMGVPHLWMGKKWKILGNE